MRHNFIYANGGQLYDIIWQTPEREGVDIKYFQYINNCTNVLKKDGIFYFVRLVEDAKLDTKAELPIENNEVEVKNLASQE